MLNQNPPVPKNVHARHAEPEATSPLPLSELPLSKTPRDEKKQARSMAQMPRMQDLGKFRKAFTRPAF